MAQFIGHGGGGNCRIAKLSFWTAGYERTSRAERWLTVATLDSSLRLKWGGIKRNELEQESQQGILRLVQFQRGVYSYGKLRYSTPVTYESARDWLSGEPYLIVYSHNLPRCFLLPVCVPVEKKINLFKTTEGHNGCSHKQHWAYSHGSNWAESSYFG